MSIETISTLFSSIASGMDRCEMSEYQWDDCDDSNNPNSCGINHLGSEIEIVDRVQNVVSEISVLNDRLIRLINAESGDKSNAAVQVDTTQESMWIVRKPDIGPIWRKDGHSLIFAGVRIDKPPETSDFILSKCQVKGESRGTSLQSLVFKVMSNLDIQKPAHSSFTCSNWDIFVREDLDKIFWPLGVFQRLEKDREIREVEIISICYFADNYLEKRKAFKLSHNDPWGSIKKFVHEKLLKNFRIEVKYRYVSPFDSTQTHEFMLKWKFPDGINLEKNRGQLILEDKEPNKFCVKRKELYPEEILDSGYRLALLHNLDSK